MNDSKESKAPLLFFFSVLFFRIIHVFLYPPVIKSVSDSERHWKNALDVLAETPTAIWDPPLYQIYLSIVMKLTGGVPLLLTAYAALLSAGCLIAWYYASSQILNRIN